MEVIPVVENVISNKDRIFRIWSDGRVEYCEMSDFQPIFKEIYVKRQKPLFVKTDSKGE